MVGLTSAFTDICDWLAAAAVQAEIKQLWELTAAPDAPIEVIGFSMGAYWALHLSQARPDDISPVVAVYGTDERLSTTPRRRNWLGNARWPSRRRDSRERSGQ